MAGHTISPAAGQCTRGRLDGWSGRAQHEMTVGLGGWRWMARGEIDGIVRHTYTFLLLVHIISRFLLPESSSSGRDGVRCTRDVHDDEEDADDGHK